MVPALALFAAVAGACGQLDGFERRPSPPGVAIDPPAPVAEEALRCQIRRPSVDPGGRPVRYAYQWARNGAPVALTASVVPERTIEAEETWACTVTPSNGFRAGTASTASVRVGHSAAVDLRAWLAASSGGWCAGAYNAFVNLCGDVQFCFDPLYMRTYPAGIDVDVGIQWDGAPGFLLDMGGDCEGKRLSMTIAAGGTLTATFMGASALTAPLRPGTRLISYRVTRAESALFVDGALADAGAGTGTSTVPELVGRCGPGVVLGQRLSYWWEPGKRDDWLRGAPFFFHLKEAVTAAQVWDFGRAMAPTAETVVLFDRSGVDAAAGRWRSRIGARTGVAENGARFVDQAFGACLSRDRPPGAPSVSIAPAAPEEGAALDCAIDVPSVDPDGDAVHYTYAWSKDGLPTDARAAHLEAGTIRAGERWRCTVTPDDGVLDGAAGSAEVAVTGPPPCHSVVLSSSVATVSIAPAGFGLGAGAWTVELWLKAHDRFQGPINQILSMNQDYGIDTLQLMYELPAGKVYCFTYNTHDDGLELKGRSERIDDGRWHHVACAYAAGTMTVYTDGRSGETVSGMPDLEVMSTVALGDTRSTLEGTAAPVEVGPLRMSRGARYMAPFHPVQRWAIDPDTLAQYLVTTGFDGRTLVDEAGGDNDGTAPRDVAAGAPAECP